jgi:hypothetical protein
LTQTSTTLVGLGMGANGIEYHTTETLNIKLGAYNDTVYIQGNPSITTTNLNTGGGTNTINIGSNAGAIGPKGTDGNAPNTGSTLDDVQGTINITGSGSDTLNVDNSGSTAADQGTLRAGSLQFFDPVLINFTGVIAINISLSEGSDIFAVVDTITSSSTDPVVNIYANGGDDFITIIDTHAVTTVNAGTGNDSLYVFGNSSVLNLKGDDGDDTFYIFASLHQNTSNVDAGNASPEGNKIYSYRVNAPVNIDGGSGNDKVYIYGTVLNDIIRIYSDNTGMHVTGAGLQVSFVNCESLVVAGLGGDDIFYIESISIPTTVIGDGTRADDPPVPPGVVLPDTTGGAVATSFNDTFYVGWRGQSYIPGSLSGINAALTIQGSGGTDTAYIDDSGDTANRNFTLDATSLTSDSMGVDGIIYYDSTVDNLNIKAGAGDDTITINGTGAGLQTTIYGGPGNDHFIVNDDPLTTPLAIVGDSNTFWGDTLTINGDVLGNDFVITGFTVEGAGATISYATVELLTINADGATTFTVNGDSIPTYLNGGDFSDTFIVNSSSAPLFLDGGASADSFTINGNSGPLTATGDAGDDVFTINGNSGSLALSGGDNNDTFTINGNSGSSLVANGDAGNDTFTVNALSSPATLNGGAGDDNFTANAPLAASLTVNGGGDAGDLLTVNGTGGNDYLIITGNTVDGAGATIHYNTLSFLVVNGAAGEDTFLVLSDSVNTTLNGGTGNDLFYIRTTDAPTFVNTGSGINTIYIGSNVPYPASSVLDNIQGAVTITGNNKDTLNIDDSASAIGKNGTLTSTTLTGLGMGSGGITYSGILSLNLLLGLNSDTLNIQSTNATTNTVVNTGTGNNVINIGSLTPASGGIVNNIQGALTIIGSGSDTMNVDDTGSVTGKNGTLTTTTLTGLGMGASGITFTGLAYLNISLGSGNDTFLISSTSTAVTTVNGNNGADTFNVRATTGVTNLNGNAGADVFNLGSLSPATGGNVNSIAGVVNINGGSEVIVLVAIGGGSDTINVDDTGDSAANSGTLTLTSLTGLGLGGGVNYALIETLNINLGSGSDTFNVQSTNATTVTTLNTGAGHNIINVGSQAPASNGVVDNISGWLIVVGSGSDTMNVDDTGSVTGKNGTLTSTTLTGLGMGTNGITYSGLACLNISLGSGNDTLLICSTASATTTLNGNNGTDTFNVRATTGTLNLNGGAGSDTFNLGSLSPATGGNLNAIAGHVNINGGTDIVLTFIISIGDTVNVDDTGTLTSTDLTGLGLGSGITYSAVETLNIHLGSGNDTFNVQGTNASTVTNLNTGSGTNTINIGSNAPGTNGIVDYIQGTLNVTGSGSDTMNVDDTGSSSNKNGTLTPTMLSGLGMGAGGITYSGLIVLNISLGSGNDSFAINDITNSTVTTVDGGPGIDSATLYFSGDFAAEELNLYHFEFASLHVVGNFTGLLNDLNPGAMQSVIIDGSFTSSGILNAGSIDTMTVGGDFAGLLNVTGLLDYLAIGGGAPGKIIAGDVHIITVQAGYGNKVLQVIEGGIERQVQANQIGGADMPDTVTFMLIYDSTTTVPQLAIRITNGGIITVRDIGGLVRFDLSLVVYSATAKFNLARVDANGNSGISNVTVEGDILTSLTQAELNFLGLAAGSFSGVVLPLDNITGVEVRDTLPTGQIHVAGIEGLAFGMLMGSNGRPLLFVGDLGSSLLNRLLGSSTLILPAVDTFRVPFSETHSVTLYAEGDRDADFDFVAAFTDQRIDNASITAFVKLQPSLRSPAEYSPIQSIYLYGDGGSFKTHSSVGSIISTGALGDITIEGRNGLGSITAPSIFGNIILTQGGITGIIQTTGIRIDAITGEETTVNADLGRLITTNGKVTVSTISTKLGISGQIISRGNLISSISVGTTFTGVIAVQGDIGAIRRDSFGAAITDGSGKLTRYGSIAIKGAASGNIIALGNIFSDLTFGALNGRIAAEGQAITGLSASRFGILGNVTTKSFGINGAVVSGGSIGDALNKTAFSGGAGKGFVAANGTINLSKTTKLSASNIFPNVFANANGAVLDAVFTDTFFPLGFDLFTGDLLGLALIQTDLNNLTVSGNSLTGTVP